MKKSMFLALLLSMGYSQAVQTGDVAVVGTGVALATFTYSLSQSQYPALAYFPSACAALLAGISLWKNDIFHQKASYRKGCISRGIGVEDNVLTIINHLDLLGIGHIPFTPADIFEHFFSSDLSEYQRAQRVTILWNELAAKIGISTINQSNPSQNYGAVKSVVDDAIRSVINELKLISKYTNIEYLLVYKVAQFLKHDLNTIDPENYLRQSNILSDHTIYFSLDVWLREFKEETVAGKFFKIRMYPTKIMGKTVWYPHYSSFTYNGASAYAVELLKQLGRLFALSRVLNGTLRSVQTSTVVHASY